MYEVDIYNGLTKTVIHYPSAEAGYPHLLSLHYKEVLSLPDQLTFDVPFSNPGYSLIQGLITRVKIIDTKDGSVIFSGRVLNTKDGMIPGGEFYNNVICEGALAYLNDTQTRRWHFQNQTPTQILAYLLDQHNQKVDISKQILVGTIQITQPITVDTNYETTLNAIVTKLHNILGGDLVIRETAGILYLDYLTEQGVNNGVKIQIATNAKHLIREWDPIDVITRAIPQGYGQGINQLNINSVNAGIEYIEDATAKAKYGVIEELVTDKAIQNANTLLIYGQTVLAEKKQPKLIIDTGMVDRSLLAQYSLEKYGLGDTLHILAPVMAIDVYARVVERDRDLINSPWDPKLIISTRPIRLSTQVMSLKQRNMALEQCPQGSTYIDTFGYAENIDAAHSFQLPIWLSPDILYVNRVRLHIDSQKFRAYEKGLLSGGGSTTTSSSGGGSTQTSSSGGSSSTTITTPPASSYDVANVVVVATSSENPATPHYHSLPGGLLAMAYQHTHQFVISILSHIHTLNIPAHVHDLIIAAHQHAIDYGIFEDTYPATVQVKINGVVVPGVVIADGGSLDMDISSYIGTPGTTYNLEVTSSRNGRVNVWVSVQAFIQIK